MIKKYVVKDFERPRQDILKKYQNLDVSTVYEAQGKKGLMNNGLKPNLQEKYICGPAVIATCYAGSNLMVHAAIEVCKPGDILLINVIGESEAGMIGELIVKALIKKQVAGVIIDAGIRDAKEIRNLDFPVWSKTVYSEGTTKSRTGWVNASTVFRGIEVKPGDLVLADEDGVVIVEQENLKNTLEASHKRMEKEAITKDKIEAGQISMDFYGLRSTLQEEGVEYYEYLNKKND